MDFMNQIISTSSLYFVGFAVLLSLQISSILYSLLPSIKPGYSMAIISAVLPWLHCIIHGVELTIPVIVNCVILIFVVFATSKGLAGRISKISRSVPEGERDMVFGKRD